MNEVINNPLKRFGGAQNIFLDFQDCGNDECFCYIVTRITECVNVRDI